MQLEKPYKKLTLAEAWGPGYQAFEILDNSMIDGFGRGIYIGDVLKCKKIEPLNKNIDLKSFKCILVVETSSGPVIGRIAHQDEEKIILSKYNPDFQDKVIDFANVESVYLVESYQRDMTPKAAKRRAQTSKI